MNKYIENIAEWSIASFSSPQNTTFLRKIKLLIIFTLLTLVVDLGLGIFFFKFEGTLPIVKYMFIHAGICLTIPIILRVTKSVSIAAHVFVIPAFIVMVYIPYLAGEIYGTPLLWLTFINIMMFSIVGRRTGYIWTFISATTIIVFFIVAINIDFPISHFIGIEHLIVRGITISLLVFIISIAIAFFQRELTNANNDLEAQTELTRSLLRVVVHDIRNPLNAIQGFSEILHEELDNQAHLNYLRMIELATANIMEITEHVEKLQSLESGKLELSITTINVREILENSKNIFQNRLHEKNISLTIDCPKEIEVVAEKVSFSNQVINNIISNAIKFSDKGGEILISASNKGKNTTQIIIKDYGIGIPSKLLDNIFSTNKITNRLGTSGEKGTGFGMPIVKAFIDKYNGTIHIHSRSVDEHPENHGTEVIITLSSQMK